MKIFSAFIGKTLSVLLLIATAMFLICLINLQILPTKILIIIGLVLAVVNILVAMLAWTGKGKAKMIVGIMVAIVMIASFVLATVYVQKTIETFNTISGGSETVHIGIYVRSEDTNEYNEVAQDYVYGILEKLDRESTDLVLNQMTQAFEKEPTLIEYQRLPDLIDSLLEGRVNAIILNQAYLDLLQEMVGYEDIMDRIRETELKQIEIKDETPVKDEKPVEDETVAEEKAPSKEEIEKYSKPFGVYISGIDTKGSVSVRSRSDVNILAVVNPETRQVVLVSTPRDYFVPLSISDGEPDKLTHAGVYGINVSKDTLAMLYGVEMDYYFRINFSGFVRLIDALGGITVNSEYAFKASRSDYTYQAGENQLSGRAALAFCRERYALGGGDRQRGKNQMAVIQGVIRKALSPALLQNYLSVLKSVEGSFETDVPISLITTLVAQQLKDSKPWNVVTCSADGTGDYQVPYSMSVKAYVMWPDQSTVDRAKSMMQDVYNGEIIEKK